MKFMDGIQLSFIILKLTKTINWNWFYVFLPYILSTTIVCIGYFLIGFFEYKKMQQEKESK